MRIEKKIPFLAWLRRTIDPMRPRVSVSGLGEKFRSVVLKGLELSIIVILQETADQRDPYDFAD